MSLILWFINQRDFCCVNVNVSFFLSYKGLFAENKEKLINGALTALLAMEGDQDAITADELENQFHALRRLVASKAGFAAFTKMTG